MGVKCLLALMIFNLKMDGDSYEVDQYVCVMNPGGVFISRIPS